MKYIGIDPGTSGAIAVLDQEGLCLDWCRNDSTERDLADFLHCHAAQSFAVIERVNAMPGIARGSDGQERRRMGAASAFTFGRSYGFLRGLLIASGIPFYDFRPQTWQQALGCLTKGNKKITKAKAQQLFPAVKVTITNADALLIAEFARRVHRGMDAVLGKTPRVSEMEATA